MATNSRPTGDGETTGPAVIGPVETVHASHKASRPWLVVGISAVAVAASMIGALVLVDHPSGSTHEPSMSLAAASASHATGKSGAQSPTTPAAIVYRLQQLMPAGRTSGYAHTPGEQLFGQIYLDQGKGPGMVRLHIDPHAATASSKAACADSRSDCRQLPDGSAVSVVRIPDNCIQSLSVAVIHPNGMAVQIDVSSCLAWNGRTNPAGTLALTEAQAIKIADDAGWGTTMDSAFVAQAAEKFPNLADVS
jgi:hypothetical protein